MPRKPRQNQIDLSRHNTYHVITRCTRQLFLLGSCDASRELRKGVLLAQLQRLARFTAVGVGGFSVMDNHLHLLLKVDVQMAQSWSVRQVAERWLALHPPRNGYFKAIDVEEEYIAAFCSDLEGVESCREKLMSISQFMKELKQETTQQLNKLDNTVGSLWAGRFKCKAVENETQLLATMAYIDLNPFAANVCKLPEEGRYTTLDARLNGEPVRGSEEYQDESEASGSTQPKQDRQRKRLAEAVYEHRGWWLAVGADSASGPLEGSRCRSVLPGIGLTFKGYLKLLDATARLLRDGKKRLASDSRAITERLTATPSRIAAEIRYWLENGFGWARLPAMAISQGL